MSNYTVEYGSRSYGNTSEGFETLEEAMEFANEKWNEARLGIQGPNEIDFVVIEDSEGNEIEQGPDSLKSYCEECGKEADQRFEMMAVLMCQGCADKTRKEWDRK